MTRGRQEIYMHGKNIGNDGAKLVANELKKNMDCLSLWLHNNGIRKEGATELAKALQFNTTLTVRMRTVFLRILTTCPQGT